MPYRRSLNLMELEARDVRESLHSPFQRWAGAGETGEDDPEVWTEEQTRVISATTAVPYRWICRVNVKPEAGRYRVGQASSFRIDTY